jgi:hypothetical protein
MERLVGGCKRNSKCWTWQQNHADAEDKHCNRNCDEPPPPEDRFVGHIKGKQRIILSF